MARLGRNLKRTLLVDDTPLAFFRQPDNGIPVLQFRWGGRGLCAGYAWVRLAVRV